MSLQDTSQGQYSPAQAQHRIHEISEEAKRYRQRLQIEKAARLAAEQRAETYRLQFIRLGSLEVV